MYEYLTADSTLTDDPMHLKSSSTSPFLKFHVITSLMPRLVEAMRLTFVSCRSSLPDQYASQVNARSSEAAGAWVEAEGLKNFKAVPRRKDEWILRTDGSNTVIT